MAELVDVLRSRLGSDAFQVIDHWPDDPMAIGIASPQNAGVLAYISVTPEADTPYFVSLELPPDGQWADHPYTPGDERNECGIDELVATIASHMRKAPPNSNVMPQSPAMPKSNADSVIDAIRNRLIAIADNPPYRYVNTSAKDRAAYEANKRSFTGYTDQQIAAAETALNVRFPAVYRSYLRIMGVTHGDLFCGSSVASINDYSDHRKFAEELINENDVKWQLDEKAVVFLEHQGYTFCYFIADGGFDSPIHQYVEGDEPAKQCSPGFAEMLDTEVALAEQNSRNFRESGGYFLTVQDGYVSQNHPARASGVRPLDLADECPHDSDTV